ncbi:flocculation protein FLO11-like [Hippocampus comes]|uniref:flocculation protein FLO11-like n=1 Tax=Hippocampus comes TaxID=109280 RepID=UPI00094E3B79|nr:PREDICTED: flocculation protein FLO11-like [Hippocampus comes]
MKMLKRFSTILMNTAVVMTFVFSVTNTQEPGSAQSNTSLETPTTRGTLETTNNSHFTATDTRPSNVGTRHFQTSSKPSTTAIEYNTESPTLYQRSTEDKSIGQDSSTESSSSSGQQMTSVAIFLPITYIRSVISPETSPSMATVQTTDNDQSIATSSSSPDTEVSSGLSTDRTPVHVETTQLTLTSNEPATTGTSSSSKPQLTSETTVTFAGSTPNEYTESASLNVTSTERKPTSQEASSGGISSTSESQTKSMTTIMSTESNTSPETSTNKATTQKTDNDQSIATSSSSIDTEVSSFLPSTFPPMTTQLSNPSSGLDTDATPVHVETTQLTLTSNEPATTGTSSSSKPQLTSETTVTFAGSTPNEYTESASLNVTSTERKPTSQEASSGGISSTSESQTKSMTTIMSTESTESNPSPETSTNKATTQTTDNDQSRATSSSSTDTAKPHLSTPTAATLIPGITRLSTDSTSPITTNAVVSASPTTNQTQTSDPDTSTEHAPYTLSLGSTPSTQFTVTHDGTRAATSAEVLITTSPTITQSQSTPTVTGESTTPQCRDEDCKCAAGNCTFSPELGHCLCLCQEGTFGDTCTFGENSIAANIGKEDYTFLNDLRWYFELGDCNHSH